MKKPLEITSSITAADTSKQVLFGQSNSNSREVLGWIPFWDQQRAYQSFSNNADVFTHISLFWYLVRSDGSVKKYIYANEDKTIINFAHSKGVKVLALVANLPDEDEGGDWDASRVEKVIGSASARKKHVADLVSLVNKYGFDGINIDYEALEEFQKESFTLFIKDLSEQMHSRGKVVAVALHPKKREGDPNYSNGSQAQDWGKLGKYADQLHIMNYEEHWETSPPGPTASVPWVESILSYAKKLIPNGKIFAGVPLYGYDWDGSSKAEGVTFTQVQSLVKKYNPKIVWDSRAKTNYFSYRDDSTSHTVWYEDNRSVSAKLNLFNNMGLNNTAFWRLGGEDPRVWTTLRNYP